MARFREVLKNRNFLLLWLGQIVSQMGDRLGQMALIGFVYLRSPGSTLQIAKILSFTIIPVFVIGPLAGVFVDRWDRRRTMYICDFFRSILLLAIPLFLFYSRNLAPIYLLIFVAFSVGRFFIPAKLSIIPDLVDNKSLLVANTLINTSGMIAAVIGFGISGILVEKLGPKSGFYLNALTFLISSSFIFFISKKFSQVDISLEEVGRGIVEVIRKSVFQEIKEGIVYFIRNKDIRFTSGIIFALWSALGSVYVTIIVFVQNSLRSATKDLGLLVMFLGLGLFLGSLVYGKFGQRISHYKVIFASLVFSGIMLDIFALAIYYYPNFILAALLALVLGLIIAPIMIATNTIIHNVSDNEMLGKIFSSLEIVMHLGFLLFMFISSILAEKFSPLLILVSVGSLLSILGLASLFLKRRVTWLN